MRRPAYPTLSGFAIALASCQASGPPIDPAAPQQPAQTSEPAIMVGAEPAHPVTVMAREPHPGEYGPSPAPPPVPPQPPTPAPAHPDFVRIEDPQAHRVPAACAGDCPASFVSRGAAVDLSFDVTAGAIPQAYRSLLAVHPSLRSCLLSWRGNRQGMRAQVSITARIGADGSVGAMDVRIGGSADSELTTCVANRIRDMRFSAPGAPATMRLIVELSGG